MDKKTLTVLALVVAGYLLMGKFATVNGNGVDVPTDGGAGPGLLDQATNILTGLVGGMTYDDSGMQLTEQSESLALTAYWDNAGQVWTIGWGHTGPDVYQGQVIDIGTAQDMLRADIAGAVATVNRLVSASLTQGQFDALVDFTFNVGSGAFASSTLLSDVNAGNFSDVGNQLSRWRYSNGSILAGLVTRRANEAAAFYA